MAPLISWAQGYQENRDKEKDTADLNKNAKPGRECLQTLPSSYRLLFFLLLECEKAKACLAGLDSRSPEF